MEGKTRKTGIKPVFIFNLHSIVDIITNSSSELFVLKSDSKKILSNLLTSVYPNYLEEYDEPKLLGFSSDEELDWYIGWVYNTYGDKDGGYRGKLDVFEGFTFEEMYEQDNTWRRRDDIYKLKPYFISNNRVKLLKILDPENNTCLLYSKDDNPNWDYQEKLMQIGEKYHLG